MKTQYIAIGNRGTTLVQLTEKELVTLKLNEKNAVLSKERFSAEQFARYAKGNKAGVLWLDSGSWISSRGEGTFLLCALDYALENKLVLKAKASVKTGKATRKLDCFVRSDFKVGEKLSSQSHKVLATKNAQGRVEAYKLKFTHDGVLLSNEAYSARVNSVELV